MICLPTKVIYPGNPSLMDHIRFWQLCYLIDIADTTQHDWVVQHVKLKKKNWLFSNFPPLLDVCVENVYLKQVNLKKKKKVKRNPINFPQLHVSHVSAQKLGLISSGKNRGEQVGVQHILQC